MPRTIALLSMMLLAGAVRGQDFLSVTSTWPADQVTDIGSSQQYANASSFQVIPSQSKIKWFQKNGTVVMEFAISSTSGAWTNLAADGSLVVNVTFSGKAGVMTFTRSGTDISISADFTQSDPSGMNNSFRVTAITQ